MKCPWCKSNLKEKTGPYGAFMGCSSFPRCRFTQKCKKSPIFKNTNTPKRKDWSSERIPKEGYIYCMTNPALSNGYCKCGFSNDPERRRKELSGTGLPQQYVIEYAYKVSDMVSAETLLHRLLQELGFNRNNPRREFFMGDPNAMKHIFEGISLIYRSSEPSTEFHKHIESNICVKGDCAEKTPMGAKLFTVQSEKTTTSNNSRYSVSKQQCANDVIAIDRSIEKTPDVDDIVAQKGYISTLVDFFWNQIGD